jgi:uncharacterized protein (DUF305 family)
MDEVRGPTDEVLPWHHSMLNVLLALAVAVVLGVGAGFFLGGSSADTAHNGVDVGFLQDMRIHHEQAVVMSTLYLGAAPDGNPTLRMIAREIMLEQQMETGRMVQLLRVFKQAETNESDQVMGWMGTPVPLSRMPGYATDAELERLHRSRGPDADELFITLMVAHHQGGVHMAGHAVEFGANDEVRAFAALIVESQTSEIAELRRLSPR